MLADSLLVHDAVARRFPGRRIVAVGFSVGTGVAAYLASRRALAGLILVTPFDSLRAVAAGHYPWVPVALLFRHEMDAAGSLERVGMPVAIIAAGSDTLVPPARTEALRRRVPNLVFDLTIPGAGHNDIYQHARFAPAMRDALAKVTGRSDPRA
jgi:pimeloyl-ACP methyl ester carboxylesterase